MFLNKTNKKNAWNFQQIENNPENISFEHIMNAPIISVDRRWQSAPRERRKKTIIAHISFKLGSELRRREKDWIKIN